MDGQDEDSDEETWLQLQPVQPLPSQCCGGGCSPCVFDIYHRDLARWEVARARKDKTLLNGDKSQVRSSDVKSPHEPYLQPQMNESKSESCMK